MEENTTQLHKELARVIRLRIMSFFGIALVRLQWQQSKALKGFVV